MHIPRDEVESHVHGFTLIELMIVVAVLAVIASMAVPSFLQSRSVADQSAVVGTIRAVVNAQYAFVTARALDSNGDGAAEFGTFQEMTGAAPMRGPNGVPLDPNLLSTSLAGVDAQGRVLKHGYYLQLYLPDPAGVGLPETPTEIAKIDATLASSYWTLVAWPQRKGQTGTATYFVNQQGELLRSTAADYTGLTKVPPAGAALLGTGDPTRIDSNRLAVGVAGADGNTWAVVR